MDKRDRICKNCAHWKQHNDGYGYGDCLCVITARLITSSYHWCVGDCKRIKFKEKEEK